MLHLSQLCIVLACKRVMCDSVLFDVGQRIHSSSRPARVHAVTSRVPRATSIKTAVPVSSCTRVFKFPRHRRNCAMPNIVVVETTVMVCSRFTIYRVQLHGRPFSVRFFVKPTGKHFIGRLSVTRFIVWFKENASLAGGAFYKWQEKSKTVLWLLRCPGENSRIRIRITLHIMICQWKIGRRTWLVNRQLCNIYVYIIHLNNMSPQWRI